MLLTPAMVTNTPTLPKTAKELEAIIEPYESRIQYLEERINTLEKVIFAPKSEKRRPDEGEGGTQLHIFNEAESIEEKKERSISYYLRTLAQETEA